MRTITNSGMIVNAFDEACYIAEQNVIEVSLQSGIQADGVALSETQGGAVVAVYTLFNRNTKLNVSELLRMKAFGMPNGQVSGSVWLRLIGSDQSYDLQVTYSVAGVQDVAKAWEVRFSDDIMLPPSRIVVCDRRAPNVDIYVANSVSGNYYLNYPGNHHLITKGSIYNHEVPGSAEAYITHEEGDVVERVWSATPYGGLGNMPIGGSLDGMCNEQSVNVIWRSRSGTEKRFGWFKKQSKFNAQGRVSLETIDGEYSGYVGVDEEFTIFLRNLTPYDIWYYSDIIFSDYVFIEDRPGVLGRKVEVLTKSVTIPDGNGNMFDGDFTLEINVKYRTYDAIDL